MSQIRKRENTKAVWTKLKQNISKLTAMMPTGKLAQVKDCVRKEGNSPVFDLRINFKKPLKREKKSQDCQNWSNINILKTMKQHL